MISQFYKIVIFIPFSIYLKSIDFFFFDTILATFARQRFPFVFKKIRLMKVSSYFTFAKLHFVQMRFSRGN